MSTVASPRIGCTRSRDPDRHPHPVVRDHRPSHFAPRRWRHKDVHVTTGDGVQLAVRDYDRPTRTHTVVFLHGFCLSRTSWGGQIDYLLRRYGDSIRIIAYDHRGHGG